MKGMIYINVMVVASVEVEFIEDGLAIKGIEFQNEPASTLVVDRSSEFGGKLSAEEMRAMNVVAANEVVKMLAAQTEDAARKISHPGVPILKVPEGLN